MTGQTGNDGTKDVEIMVPLKYLSNFWRTLEMPLINCEVNLILTWSSSCVLIATGIQNQNATFAITDTKLYSPVVTLSTQENTKFLQQLKSGFKRVINWNKFLSKPELLAQNPNFKNLVEPSFQGVNRLFVLAFENDDVRTGRDEYYLPTVEIKDFNIVIDGENFFDQPIKNNKIWVDEGSEFYNAYFKKWLRDNDIVMYSTHNEGKSVVAERFIRTLKSKIYKYMTSISKNVYIDKLDDIVDEYNNTYHTTIKMKPIDVKDNTYINTSKEINNKDPKFKVGDHVRISKYKNIFAKGYMPNWSEEVFVIKKVKNTIPWTYVINNLNVEEIIGTFYEKELQKMNQEEFRIEKVIRRKGNKIYVKWKVYDNSFNSWIDKGNLVQRT